MRTTENNLDKSYIALIREILKDGRVKPSGRANIPDTVSLTGTTITHHLGQGFPLLTTKQMHFSGIFYELIWFLNGSINIKYLVDNQVNIWNKNAYDWYSKACIRTNQNPVTLSDFVEIIRRSSTQGLSALSSMHFEGDSYVFGDLGKIYGYQWRKGKDQLKTVYNELKNNPYSRYHIISGWSLEDKDEMALPPCHLLYHFNPVPLTNEEQTEYGLRDRLDLIMYQRSVDVGLGLPYNLASMALFLTIMAKATGKVPGKIVWNGGDTHIYLPHIESLEEQLTRCSYPLPELQILKELNTFQDILDLTIDDVRLWNYVSHPKLTKQPELFA